MPTVREMDAKAKQTAKLIVVKVRQIGANQMGVEMPTVARAKAARRV